MFLAESGYCLQQKEFSGGCLCPRKPLAAPEGPAALPAPGPALCQQHITLPAALPQLLPASGALLKLPLVQPESLTGLGYLGELGLRLSLSVTPREWWCLLTVFQDEATRSSELEIEMIRLDTLGPCWLVVFHLQTSRDAFALPKCLLIFPSGGVPRMVCGSL